MTAIAHTISEPDSSEQKLARLKERCEQGFDPVRFRFMEAMWQRAAGQRESVRRIMLEKLQLALDSYSADCEKAKASANQSLQQLAQHPQIDALQALYERSDYKGVLRQASRFAPDDKPNAGSILASLTEQLCNLKLTKEQPQESSPFENLLLQQDQEAVASLTGFNQASAPGADPDTARATVNGTVNSAAITKPPVKELAAGQRLKTLTRKHYDDTLITQALLRAPEDPGPLNAHKLLISALSTMRDLSPKYVSRFATLGESLLWLEEMDRREPAAAKPNIGNPNATKSVTSKPAPKKPNETKPKTEKKAGSKKPKAQATS